MLQDDRTITPDEDNEMAVARSLQVFGQVISCLASKNRQLDETEQADIEIPYKESVRIYSSSIYDILCVSLIKSGRKYSIYEYECKFKIHKLYRNTRILLKYILAADFLNLRQVFELVENPKIVLIVQRGLCNVIFYIACIDLKHIDFVICNLGNIIWVVIRVDRTLLI